MSFNKTTSLIICIFCLISFPITQSQAQVSEAEELYEQGIYQLEAAGDFEEAITLFSRIVTEYPGDKSTAAKALLKLGLCYERQGSQKAEDAYEQIIEKFADQTPQVAEARQRLSALRQHDEPTGQTVKIIYDEGVTQSNCLSPDGSKMAIVDFSEGQNIAYYDFTIRERKLVTHYNWFDFWTFWPLWSPDGKELVYIKSGWKTNSPHALCVMSQDGKERTLYQNQAPGSKIYPAEWMPTGTGIIATLQDSLGFRLAIIPIDGGDVQILKTFDGDNYGMASASPDGRYVAYSIGPQGNKDIEIIDLETMEVSIFTDNPADDGAPRWSPDGKYMVFRSNRHGDYAIWGVEMKQGKPVGTPSLIMPGTRDMKLLNWTTSGLAINMVIMTADLYKLPLDPISGKSTGEPSMLRYTPTGSNIAAVWAPDGRHIAFYTFDMNKGKIDVVVTDDEGSGKMEYPLPPKCGNGILRWTPDGKAISFAGLDTTQKFNLFILSLEKGNWTRWPLGMESLSIVEWDKDGKTFYYTDNGMSDPQEKIFKRKLGDTVGTVIYEPENMKEAFGSVACSRDHSKLAFQQDNYIMVMDLSNYQARLVTPVGDTAASINGASKIGYRLPTWSPDGTKLIVNRKITDEKMNQKFELCVIDLATGNIEDIDLGNSLPKDAQIRFIDWSPDGKELIISTVSWVSEDHLMKNVIPNAL